MAGAMTAWIAEMRAPRPSESAPDGSSSLVERLAGAVTPLTAACAVLAVSPDFDVFFHSHRTYSHSLGAAGVVWLLVALAAWRLRLPVVRTATVCAAAYASHVLLDWLGRDDSFNGGLMVLWPLTTDFYRSGLNLFLEIGGHPRAVMAHPAAGFLRLLMQDRNALARELMLLGVPFLLMLKLRLGREREPAARVGQAGTRHGVPLPRPAQNELRN